MKKIACTLLFCLFLLTETFAASQQLTRGHWRVSKSTDPLTSEQIYRAVLDGWVQAKPRDKNKIRLTVRCQNKKAQLLINWYKFLGEKPVAVSHAIDGEPKDISIWDVIGSKTTTALPDSPALFMQRLQDGRKLEATVKPWRGEPINAVFQLNGAQSALADISKDCY